MGESEKPPENTFRDFGTIIYGIEFLSAIGRRVSDAVAQKPCEYLIQEATMAFVKTMMSLQAFLRFIPSSKFHAKEVEFAVDLSSASVMARQVMEDVISFLYLSEPNLTNDEKIFRALVWSYHGATETIGSLDFIAPERTDAQLVAVCQKAKELLSKPPCAAMLDKIEKGNRQRIKKGQLGHVLHDREILSRRGIRLDAYDFWSKTLSNFAHFSTLSHRLILQTTSDWKSSWKSFYTAAFCVANFGAEAVESFLETFPQTRPLLSPQEQSAVANLRSWLRSGT
jgi:hypothetical protein